jgi:hypothetical protein
VAQRTAPTKKIKAFIAKASQQENEDRAILKNAPGVGFVTAEVLLSELGDINQFRNFKTVSAYAGLAPAVRQSGDKRSKDMRITKEGTGLMRWVLVESAWRLVGSSPKWSAMYTRLKQRKRSERAIVAVDRKLLCVLYTMLRTPTAESTTTAEAGTSRTTRKTSVKAPTADQTTTTRAVAGRPTRKWMVKAYVTDQTTIV